MGGNIGGLVCVLFVTCGGVTTNQEEDNQTL